MQQTLRVCLRLPAPACACLRLPAPACACLPQAGAVNSPPDSGGAALGVVRLFGTLNQKYM